MLLIIDNQSQYIKKFKRNYLDDIDIPLLTIDHNEMIDFRKLPEIQGVILSGGKGNPYEPLNLTANYVALMNIDVPTIGFCLGHEIIAVAYKGRIKRLADYQSHKESVYIDEPHDPIFEGLNKSEIRIQKKHRFHVPNLPEEFVRLGHSMTCPNEIIRHKEKPIYSFQGHPEVSGDDGLRMMGNFLRMCGFSVEA